jgi:hypothetical protein
MRENIDFCTWINTPRHEGKAMIICSLITLVIVLFIMN